MNYKTRQPFPHAAYVEGQRNFTYFDRSLTSGLTDVVIESPGDFLYIDQASTGVVSVELNMRQGGTLAPILLAAGGSIECDFASIKLNATAQLNKTVRIIVGNGARIKGGANVNASSMSVSVVDGGLVRTKNNQAFGGAGNVSAGAAVYPVLQLWNPSASTKNLFLEKCKAGSGTAQTLVVAGSITQLASSMGALWIQNKYIGNADGIGDVRYEATATSGNIGILSTASCIANSSVDFVFTEPVLIAPGCGVIIYGGTAATAITASFEWYEE